MFCPVCKAEYRQGFTRCADCDVELVYELPAAALVPHAAAAPGDSEEDPFCSFWTGDDPRIHAELVELLEKEGIPQKTIRRADHLFHILSYPAFQIGIPFSMFERAEAAVKEAYGSDEAIEPASRPLPVDSEHLPGSRLGPGAFGPWAEPVEGGRQRFTLPSITEPPADRDEPDNLRVRGAGRNIAERDEEEPSTEVWSGDEPELGDFIAASLETNKIPFRRAPRTGKYVLYVHAEDEAQAREIVREVVEGRPPE
ncbi:MAG: hypothetical protein WBE13_19035 [Candidatus Acidiferrum sp.]